ncbi:MAG TPA: RNA polymerase Rpb4 family protein [Candidatus Thermoplasmatota archaeon]|jgi:DNA-directed RNA polymerase subunit F|nr:RNA polymerase Rpb4 family protein [Candidatus Thermoplasmatota archaeon]
METSTEETGKIVSLAEVKNILKKISKERKELLYEQKIALEHAEKFAKLSAKQTKDLIVELMKLDHVEELQAYKIADILPSTEDDIRAIFAKERYTPNDKEIKNILEIVKKHSVE